MPMDRSKYPPDWEQISKRIRFERAKGKCEWCHVRHLAIVQYDEYGDFVYVKGNAYYDQFQYSFDYKTAKQTVEFLNENRERDEAAFVMIVITTAHLGIAKPDGTPGSKEDRMDCRDENLAALCQRCHLNFDRPDNLRSARRKRQRKSIALDGLFDYSIQ